MTTGFLILDKPTGITSRDAVDLAAAWFPKRTRIGHAGTLDPLATGVLVVAVGQATRLIEYVQDMSKVYHTRIIFGATSDTDDADGTITPQEATPVPEMVVREAIDGFSGEVEQVPPDYSAAHIDGHRAYALARQGKEVTLSARTVRLDRVEVLSYAWPELELEVHCGKGTYIRAIARDLGTRLGVGGYVRELRRLSIGAFTTAMAIGCDAGMNAARAHLMSIRTAIRHLPSHVIDAEAAQRLRMGQRLPLQGKGEVQAIDEQEQLVAVGKIAEGLFQPTKVFAPG